MKTNEMALFQFKDVRTQVPLQQRMRDSDQKKLKQAADDFESLFVKKMLDSMKSTLHKESRIINGGFAEEVFEDMLYDEYARLLTTAETFGISEAIVKQFSSP